MDTNVILKIIGYALIPLIMAWIGNHLAAEVVENARRRRVFRVLFISLVVIGIIVTTFVEFNSDSAHRKEVSENAGALLRMQATVTATQLQSAADLGYLKGRLDAALNRPNFDAAGFSRAFASAAEGLVEKSIKDHSDGELKRETFELTHKMREFEAQFRRREDAVVANWFSSAGSTNEQRQAAFSRQTAALTQLSEQRSLEYREKYLARAQALRDELIERLGSNAPLPAQSRGRLIAFDGFLAGPSPISDAADYLDLLATKLPENAKKRLSK